MNNRGFLTTEKIARQIALFVAFTLSFAFVVNGQKAKCKKWTYDFSETVKYFDTPQEACKAYVKEKYPNDNYKAIVEATNDAETYRCSADDTYIGVVYKRECDSCCKAQMPLSHFRSFFYPQQFITDSSCLSLNKMTNRDESIIPSSDCACLTKTIFGNYATE